MKFCRFLLVPLAVSFLFSCSPGAGTKGGGEKGGGLFKRNLIGPRGVTAYVANSREVPLVIDTSGETEPIDRFEAKAPTNVQVVKVFVEEGARVQAGDPLVKFEDELVRLRLAKARAEIAEAEAGLDSLGFSRKNREVLLEEGKLSELEAEGLDAKEGLYRATIDRAKVEIELYERVEDLDQLNSPIGGVVVKKEVSDGSNVSQDQRLLEVVRLDPIYFVFRVKPDDLSAIEKNSEITVRLTGLAGQEFSGEVAAVGAEVEDAKGTVSVKLKIPNPELAIKGEMTGAVLIRTAAQKKVLMVPDSAVLRGDRSNYLFKIEGEKIRKAAIDLGTPYNGQPTVEKGLSDGETIVAEAEEDLKDGMTVEIEATRTERLP